jgi:hypothetical protein
MKERWLIEAHTRLDAMLDLEAGVNLRSEYDFIMNPRKLKRSGPPSGVL